MRPRRAVIAFGIVILVLGGVETALLDGGNAAMIAMILALGSLVVVAATTMSLLTRKREDEAARVHGRVADALLCDLRLVGLPIAAAGHVPLWRGSPATLELTGQVPSDELHDVVLRVAAQEASRVRPDFRIEDHISVIPSKPRRAA